FRKSGGGMGGFGGAKPPPPNKGGKTFGVIIPTNACVVRPPAPPPGGPGGAPAPSGAAPALAAAGAGGAPGRLPLTHPAPRWAGVGAREAVAQYARAEPPSPAFFDTANLRPACAYHNSQKRDTPGDEYVARLLRQQHAERGPA